MSKELLAEYWKRYDAVLSPTASLLENLIRDHLDRSERIDRISARAKHPDRFIAKAEKIGQDGKLRYPDPFVQIQDLIGARVIVYYQSDIAATADVLERYFRPIEVKTIVPDSEWKFGYFGRHFIMKLPGDAIPSGASEETAPTFFELQIKTLFQHAWSEAEHDLGYKPADELSPDQQRLLAYTSAQAWGADEVFRRLASELLPL